MKTVQVPASVAKVLKLQANIMPKDTKTGIQNLIDFIESLRGKNKKADIAIDLVKTILNPTTKNIMPSKEQATSIEALLKLDPKNPVLKKLKAFITAWNDLVESGMRH